LVKLIIPPTRVTKRTWTPHLRSVGGASRVDLADKIAGLLPMVKVK